LALTAELALLEEQIRFAKKSQLISDVGAFVGAAIAVFGFLYENYIIGVAGAALFVLGFAGGTYFLWRYTKLTRKLAQLAYSSVCCPECKKKVPKENYANCPFCGAELKTCKLQPKT
jgi:hypothetical protein